MIADDAAGPDDGASAVRLPPLPETTILLVEVGSTAHGTGIPGGEDYDQLGVVVEPPDQVLGLDDRGFRTVMVRTQPEGVRSGPGDVDRTLHSLRRFVRLAASGNPSILMALWAPVDHATAEGKELQALGEAFMGRHVVPRYRGYMQSQAQRLLGTRGGGHGRRGGGGREELVEARGYDTKYAMHCARLGFQCQELLTTSQLQLPVQGGTAEWLRAVRRGEIDFDEWWTTVLRLDDQLAAIEHDARFRPGPDQKRIERWSIATHRRIWQQIGGDGSP
ncbi:MAG TPA: nucleotidyltransferase domain-containing protein [Microthrixaceae bacterium]|nr:nucleotidyltransferase domain-containing protein [Acidimicrobiales bacterium]MCB9399963.1 nucleotidyltransferase domain-containing protein [Microthrixaceae bacterium]MCO5305869.1 nucleotidyltransferase domain-containing protein [Microthrixaceae bacterium]HPG13924.1 nucleotidyltransferase domain-containing protein [Microthrixaceae bacterium]